VPNIQHLPGVIEMDVLDSFKMLCRRVARIQAPGEHDSKHITMSTERFPDSIDPTQKK
jgi:hypothetical protein